MSKDLLQGKLFRHPLHTFLVHFPIGLLALSFFLDLGSLMLPSADKFATAAFYSMAAGVFTALLAAVPGLVDYLDIRSDHPAKRVATTHMTINLVVIALYASNLGLRYKSSATGATEWLPLLLSLAGMVMLGFSGYLGGTLVYDDGISVGRHRRRTPAPQKTIKIGPLHSDKTTPSPEPTNFIAVGDAASIIDGQTLRVSVRGTVLTIAKLDGKFFAFQEFCTHRFGPLSDGCLHDGEIECPWHRSRFDVRTGKVTQGPAKVDLKTFPVEVQDGKIRVGM